MVKGCMLGVVESKAEEVDIYALVNKDPQQDLEKAFVLFCFDVLVRLLQGFSTAFEAR